MKFFLVVLLCPFVVGNFGSAYYTGIQQGPDFQVPSFISKIQTFFSQDNPIGIPGVVISDPISSSLEFNLSSWVSASDLRIYGLSKIQFHYISFNFSDCKVHAEGRVPELILLGDYSFSLPFTSVFSGITNVTLWDVELFFDGGVVLDREGLLQISRKDIQLELTYRNLTVDSTNLGSYLSHLVEYMFPDYIPSLQERAEEWFHNFFSQSLRSSVLTYISFPDSIHVVDFLLTKVRSSMKEIGFDLLPMPPLWIDVGAGFFYLMCDDVILEGLSSLHWTHNTYVKYVENDFQLFIQARTQTIKVTGTCGLPYISLLGSVLEIQMDYIEITLEIHQRAHLKNPPTLRVLQVDLGYFEIRSEILGTVGYITEAMANILPNLLKKQIQEILNEELWKVLQSHLSSLDMSIFLPNDVIKQEKMKDQCC